MEQPSKRVGIITMHRVLNFGSALQTYALQRKVEELGYRAEVIDYVYPNQEHWMYFEESLLENPPIQVSLLERIKRRVMGLLCRYRLSPDMIAAGKFRSFLEQYVQLSERTYANRYQLGKFPPSYDLYLTGSDQVWNPSYVGYDTSFMFGFVRDAGPRFSYAASFATNQVPEQFVDCYRRELMKYSAISVREKSAQEIVSGMTGTIPPLVCDPTLLLTREEWCSLASVPETYEITRPYILVYILEYSYNPYPHIFDIIEKVHRKFGGQIIVLYGQCSRYMKDRNALVIDDAGPLDFLRLFLNASFVVTTSFHGTAFSLNFGLPFMSVVKDKSGADSRMYGLLRRVGAESHAVVYDDAQFEVPEDMSVSAQIKYETERFRAESLGFLKKSLDSED